MNLANFNGQDFENLAIEILKIKDSSSEEQLMEDIGAKLYLSDLEVSEADPEKVLVPSLWNENKRQFNFNKVLHSPFLMEVGEQANLQISFKILGGKLLKKVNKAICNSEVLKSLFEDSDKLSEKLKTLIPVILSIITTSVTLGPAGLAVAVLVVAYLLKVGYGAYCSIA